MIRTHSILIIAAIVFMSSGCSGLFGGGSSSGSNGNGELGTSPPIVDIPSIKKLDTSINCVYFDREALTTVLSDAFTNSSFPISVSAILKTAITDNSMTFGLACNPYGSGCAGAYDAALSVDSSTVKQLTKTKVCEDLVAASNSLKAVMINASLSSDGSCPAVTEAGIENVAKLFFRNRDLSPTEISAYSAMNKSLISKGRALDDRWNLIILMLCESPDWEIL
jgi:hypothetical protein